MHIFPQSKTAHGGLELRDHLAGLCATGMLASERPDDVRALAAMAYSTADVLLVARERIEPMPERCPELHQPMTVHAIAEAIADEFTSAPVGGDANVEHQAIVNYVRLTAPDERRFKVTNMSATIIPFRAPRLPSSGDDAELIGYSVTWRLHTPHGDIHVTKDERRVGGSTTYEGPDEALLALGIATSEMLPQRPKRTKCGPDAEWIAKRVGIGVSIWFHHGIHAPMADDDLRRAGAERMARTPELRPVP